MKAVSNDPRSAARRRPTHRWLYALPNGQMPQTVKCAGVAYEHVRTFKHDFFAATGLYRAPDGGLHVLKLNRIGDLLSLPADWIGRFLAREIRFYEQLAGVPGVPRLTGRVGPTGLLHEYVPGRVLGRDDRVGDYFFAQLDELIGAIHARDMAYVDLNSCENILVGDDGRPYLFDFQISLWLPRRGWRGVAPLRWLLTRFQQADRYHTLKHKRRLRPDLLTAEQREQVGRLSVWIRLHRAVARPLTQLRRRALANLAKTEQTTVVGSDAK